MARRQPRYWQVLKEQPPQRGQGFVPPQAVRKAAALGLDLREEFGRGGTEVGLARAEQLVNAAEIPERALARMRSYFARHAVDARAEGWGDRRRPSTGWIAWLLWGGDLGRAWVNRLWQKNPEGTVPLGTILYHGTSTEEQFEESGSTPDGPAWFSDAERVAQYFSRWHAEGHPRVIVYRVVREPRLFEWSNRDDLAELFAEDPEDEDSLDYARDYLEQLDIHDTADEVLARGYDGWIIPNNYPEGADIMLGRPEQFLESV